MGFTGSNRLDDSPKDRCKAKYPDMVCRRYHGVYIVEYADKPVGHGLSAYEAWRDAEGNLEAKYG